MLSHRTLTRLANLIQAVAEGEQKTEVIRQVLAEQRHFEPQSAFRRIDQTKSGQLSASDILNFLEDNKIIISNKEAVQLLRILDTNADARVTYSDFAESILPQEDSRLKQIASLRESYYLEDGEALPYEAEWSLARVLEQELKNFRNFESLKDILSSSYDFNKLDLFNAIDDLRQGSLTISAVDEFLRNQGKVLSQDQLLALFRRAGAVNVISYPQFIELVSPIEPTPTFVASHSRLGSASRLGSSQRSFRPNTSQRGFNTGSSQLNRSRVVEDIEKDIEYQDYLARSVSFERIRSSNASRSPERRSNSGQNLRSIMNSTGRSAFRTPINNELTQSFFSGSESRVNQTVLSATKSPMRGNEEEHLVKAIKDQISLDRTVEELKNQLSFRHDFNVEDAFRIIDRKGRGYVSKLDFELSLNEIGIFPTKDELYLFFKRYDVDGNALLKFSEFTEVVRPNNVEYAALSKSRMPNYVDPEEGISGFSVETRRLYKKLLNKVLQSEVEAEYIRQKLSRRPLFSLYDAFQAIDTLDSGFITLNGFKRILQNHGIFVTQNDLQALVKRYDRNQDNRVTLPEFLNELQPKSPVKQY